MSWYRYLPLPLILGAVWLLTAAHSRRSDAAPESPQMPRLAPTAPSDIPCLEAIDRAMDALAPDRVGWLETTLWQRGHFPDCAYQADGRYLIAPDGRFRLELHTRQGHGEAALLAINDGMHLWEARRTAPGNWSSVTHVYLGQVRDALEGPSGSVALREEYQHGPAFRGVVPLLRELRERVAWVRQAPARSCSVDCIELTGVVRLVKPPERSGTEGLVTVCRLCLDARTSWPHRIEWWGPGDDGTTVRLLAEEELREPHFLPAIPEERCAREFHFEPGDAPLIDRTAEMLHGQSGRTRAKEPVTEENP
jgi:hypothetical protein